MPELPTGTVTFLFTDVEGSTRLLQRIGDAYRHLLSAHDQIPRSLASRLLKAQTRIARLSRHVSGDHQASFGL